MIFRHVAFKAALVAGGFALALGAMLSPRPAEARVFVGFGFGVPLYGPWYAPPPFAYGPPVVYAPPRVVYAPPADATFAPAPQSWYYCDNPRGYYPYVTACAGGWRPVPATPAPSGK